MPGIERELVIVPAGAGAGKTHRIQETLSEWVNRKLVKPERILAVTYTEAAAAELRERIRSGLLARGMVAEALAAERAYISTIHGLGLRLLTEHAMAAGTSPQPRHLSDAERDLLIRQALAHASSLDPIKADPKRYGYDYDWQSEETAEGILRRQVLAMVDLLRGLGDTGSDPKLIDPALARLEGIYGKVLQDPESARDALVEAVCEMLTVFPTGGMEGVDVPTPRNKLEQDHRLLEQVRRDPAVLDRDWGIWEKLRHLFVSNRNTKTPNGYDRLAEDIRAAADSITCHPGPLEDAKTHLRCMITCAQEVMAAYEKRKRALGLIDFADMISGAERLLRTNQPVLNAVLAEIDCVIIDEFQDTSPVQFAFLRQLGQQARRTLFVGDVKQSIMGFQGADPRLSAALADANPLSRQPLTRNWRSTPEIMQFVNALGQGLFGTGYDSLEPERASVDGPALEILRIKRGRRVEDDSKPQAHIAERVARILYDAEQVIDKQSKEPRILRPSDIAVLVCRHKTAQAYAAELRLRNVPVRIMEDGWITGEVIRVACAALSFAANPHDIHAALIFRTMGPQPLSLEEALCQQIDGSLLADPLLKKLAELSDRLLLLPVSAALGLVSEAAGLEDWLAGTEDSAQARADLLRLEAEAQAFEAAHRDLRAASGFHGQGVKVFLGWLEARDGEREFDNRPDPSSNSAEAVEIVTWHACKGREWPITVVAEFDNKIEERPRTTSARFGLLDRIDDMAAVLASAELIHTPDFAVKDTQKRYVEDRRDAFEATARNLLYVALTRARDRIVIEWPEFLKKRNDDPASCLFHVLEDTCHPVVGNDSLLINGVQCAARITTPGAQAEVTTYAEEGERRIARFGLRNPLPQIPLTPWRLQPSSIKEASVSAPPSRNISLGEPWPISSSSADRGTAVHLAMRTYLMRPDLAGNLSIATGLDSEMLARIGKRAKALKDYLMEEGYSEIRSEIPISVRLLEGTEVSSTIDLIASGGAGCIVIDHKSGGLGKGMDPYWSQILNYVKAFPSVIATKPLRSVAVYWLDFGTLSKVDL